jgi:hypothetical protein
MRIKRFYEQDENQEFEEKVKLAPETIDEILKKIEVFSALLDEKLEELEDITDTIANFKSNSTKANTQIDDSHLYLQEVSQKLKDSVNRLDDIHNNLKNYNESGEKYLY